MNKFVIYIVNYLPSDRVKRKARLDCHKRQLADWIKYTDIPINIISMNYNKLDYEINDRITYHDSITLPLGKARHICFEHFFSSNYDFAIMMDDDATLYKNDKKFYGGDFSFFEEVSRSIEDYDDIDVIFPLNPQKQPFNHLYVKENGGYKDSHYFIRDLDLKGSMFIVRNFRKYKTHEIKTDPNFTWCEDGKFAIDCVAAGLRVYKCPNLILKELPHKASNFSDDNGYRKEQMKLANREISRLHHHNDLFMKEESHLLDKKPFLKKCWNGPTKLKIPKENMNLFQTSKRYSYE